MYNWTVLLEWLQFIGDIGVKSLFTFLLTVLWGLLCILLGGIGDFHFHERSKKISWENLIAGIWSFLVCSVVGLATIGCAFKAAWELETPLGYALLVSLPIALLVGLWQSRVFARLRYRWRESCSG